MRVTGVKAIANLLKNSDRLQKLSIDFNELGLPGTKALIKVVAGRRCRG